MMHLNDTDTFSMKLEKNHSYERLVRQWLMDGKNQEGIELDKEDEVYKWTPVHWAAYFGKMNCLQAITLHKPIVDQPSSNFGQTPLHVAAFTGQFLCVKWLIDVGANVNNQDIFLETPLHKAARTGNTQCLDILIKNGAETRIANKDGLTPEIICYLCGHLQCYDYLTRIGPLNLSNGFHEQNRENYDAKWIRKGLNGGHLPDISQSFHSENLVTEDVNIEMDIDDSSVCKRGIESIKTSSENFISGRKRSYGDVNSNVIKRMKSNEDSSDEFLMEQGTVQLENQRTVHIGNMYSLYAYSTLIADMHGS